MSAFFPIVVAFALGGAPDDNIKVASGTVESTDVAQGRMVVRTPAGPVVFLVSGSRGLDNLVVGRSVELHFFVNDGARVIDISPANPTPQVVAPEPLPMTPENLKSTAGTVASLGADGARMTVWAPAGAVVFQTNRAMTTGLSVGQQVRVWYFVHDGAQADHVDVLAPASMMSKPVSRAR
jgi:hypothetical protein